MRLEWLLVGLCGCAADRTEQINDPLCCQPVAEAPVDRGLDFAARVEGPTRCVEAARAQLPSQDAWRSVWGCVQDGHFTALRAVLSGAWDRDLQTRADAPLLIARVIAERGGDVDDDLSLLHERRVPLFSLSQALARPEKFRGALLIMRARLSPQGVLNEMHLVGQSTDVQLGLTYARQGWPGDSRRFVTGRRSYNYDVMTGQRVLDKDPFIDARDSVVVLARFDGLRDSDGWPEVSVIEHFLPSATISY